MGTLKKAAILGTLNSVVLMACGFGATEWQFYLLAVWMAVITMPDFPLRG